MVLRKLLWPDVEETLTKLTDSPLREGKDFPAFGPWLAALAGHPSKQVSIIGIVGTNGKTTTNALVRYLLVAAGKKVLEVGTLGALLWEGGNDKAPASSLRSRAFFAGRADIAKSFAASRDPTR